MPRMKQSSKVNHAYSLSKEIPFGILQGSVLEPILFNTFLSDMFLVISDTDCSSCTDDNTIYDSGNSIDDVTSSLKESSENLFQWFSHNQTKGNSEMSFHCQHRLTNKNSSVRVFDKKTAHVKNY